MTALETKLSSLRKRANTAWNKAERARTDTHNYTDYIKFMSRWDALIGEYIDLGGY